MCCILFNKFFGFGCQFMNSPYNQPNSANQRSHASQERRLEPNHVKTCFSKIHQENQKYCLSIKYSSHIIHKYRNDKFNKPRKLLNNTYPKRQRANTPRNKFQKYLIQNKDIQRPSILKRNFSTKLRLETCCTQNLGTNS